MALKQHVPVRRPQLLRGRQRIANERRVQLVDELPELVLTTRPALRKVLKLDEDVVDDDVVAERGIVPIARRPPPGGPRIVLPFEVGCAQCVQQPRIAAMGDGQFLEGGR